MATLTQGAVARPSFRARLRGAATRFERWLETRREREQILHELRALDARDLKDLQISHYDFDAIAEGRFRR
jgi:uncharacterized protein YjiS (DUF1127 family)